MQTARAAQVAHSWSDTTSFSLRNARSATHASAKPCEARWRSGYAPACKAVYTGSIPVLASTLPIRSGEFSSIAFRTNFLSAGKLQIIEPGRSDAGLFENRLKFETLEALSISSGPGMRTVMSLTQ